MHSPSSLSGVLPSTSIGGITPQYIPMTCAITGCPSQFGAVGESVPHRLSCGDVVCAGCWGAAQSVGNCPVCGVANAKLEFVDEALAIVGKTLGYGISACSPAPALLRLQT